MTIAIAIYHSEVQQYPKKWVQDCLDSLYHQDILYSDHIYDSVIFYELNYGNTDGRITDCRNFRHRPLVNYAAAMNEIYGWICENQTIQAIANVNIDDYYRFDRLSTLQMMFYHGYDIVSSNYIVLDENGKEKYRTEFANLDVAAELARGNNIVSNPCHIMKRKVFEKLQFDPALVPGEDLVYWQECIKAGFKIKIADQYLHYRREHAGQEGNKRLP